MTDGCNMGVTKRINSYAMKQLLVNNFNLQCFLQTLILKFNLKSKFWIPNVFAYLAAKECLDGNQLLFKFNYFQVVMEEI